MARETFALLAVKPRDLFHAVSAVPADCDPATLADDEGRAGALGFIVHWLPKWAVNDSTAALCGAHPHGVYTRWRRHPDAELSCPHCASRANRRMAGAWREAFMVRQMPDYTDSVFDPSRW